MLNKLNIKPQDIEEYNLASKIPTEESKKQERLLTAQIKSWSNTIINLWIESRGKCGYCGAKVTPDNYTLDHIIPISKGGLTNKNNLIICCTHCNRLKADLNVNTFINLLQQYKKNLNIKYRKWTQIKSKSK